MIDELVAKASGGGLAAQVALRDRVRVAAAEHGSSRDELLAFLRSTSPRGWLTLDQSMRAQWYGETRPSGRAPMGLVRGVLASLAGARRDVLDIGLASMSRDGHQRECAVRALEEVGDPLAGPFLALRSGDWVEEVAQLATSILAERLTIEAPTLVASAPLVFALVDRRRQSGLASVVLERAAAETTIRRALLASLDRRTRREVISHRPVQDATSLEDLVEIAESDTDTSVAAEAGIAAVARLGAGTDDDGLERLLAGPAPVRYAVLEALPASDRAREAAAGHLFDRSSTVRTAAQRAYARAGGDAAGAYRATLSRGEHVATAILELASIGGAQDHPVILAALQSPESSIRRAAVKAVGWIAPERVIELLVPMLRDSAPGVTRAAERRLRASASSLDGAILFDLAGASAAHMRRAAYRLLRRRSAPERLEAGLIGLADADAANQRTALGDLRSWLWKGAASAPRADLATRQRLSDRLRLVESQMDSHIADQIRFHAALRPADLGG